MWFVIKNVVSPETIAAVRQAASDLTGVQQDRHFVSDGKTFFRTRPELLDRIHSEVAATIPLETHFQNPAINHAFLLYKSPGGPPTHIHQDRPYWLDIETDRCTMFTAWVALENIDETNGAMMFDKNNRADSLDAFLATRRDDSELETHDEHDTGIGFSQTIQGARGEALRSGLSVAQVSEGDVVLFDAYEPHCSAPNDSANTRLAMKIVYGEAENMSSYLRRLDEAPAEEPAKKGASFLDRLIGR